MSATNNTYMKWWGTIDFPQGQTRLLQCADLQLHAQADSNQWLIDFVWQHENHHIAPECGVITETDSERRRENEQRFVFARQPKQMVLQPCLADRPVMCRPVVSVSVLPLQEVTLYVCLPLWLQLLTPDSEQPVLDIPSTRVCDSWFGPNTWEGVFSYASRVSDQLDIHPITNNKAMVAVEVRIQNQSPTLLTLDKISVPAPNLSLFADAKGQFWTPRITLVRGNHGDAILSIDEVMSCGLTESELQWVAKPREDIGRSKITKAISTLFG